MGADEKPLPGVAYVLTHYPATALTFISLEVRELERAGWQISPISVNAPDAAELASPGAQLAHDQTLYLKRQGLASLMRSVMMTWLGNPVAFTGLAWRAVRSAQLDLSMVARRLVHLAYACSSWRAVRDRGVTHFHAHFGQTPATIAWFAAEVGRLSGRRCTWSFTIHGFQDFADERVTRLDLKVPSASFVVCVSDYTRAQLYRVTDPSMWGRYEVVRCGVDLDALQYREPGIHDGPLRVLVVARLSPEKGHTVLLDALRRVAEDGYSIELRVVGRGPSESRIRAVVADLGMDQIVSFTGELGPADVAREFAAADVFCLPSFAEGIPVSIMEAMAVGVPVVTTYVGGIPELATDQHTALVVPAGNAELLAAALRRLADDPELRLRLATAARASVAANHNVRTNVARLASLLSEAGSDPPASSDDRRR